MAGQPPFGVSWMKEGQWIPESLQPEAGTTASFLLRALGPGDAAGYQAIVSNAFGVVTSRVARLNLHFVDAAAPNPVPPFTNWLAAAHAPMTQPGRPE